MHEAICKIYRNRRWPCTEAAAPSSRRRPAVGKLLCRSGSRRLTGGGPSISAAGGCKRRRRGRRVLLSVFVRLVIRLGGVSCDENFARLCGYIAESKVLLAAWFAGWPTVLSKLPLTQLHDPSVDGIACSIANLISQRGVIYETHLAWVLDGHG